MRSPDPVPTVGEAIDAKPTASGRRPRETPGFPVHHERRAAWAAQATRDGLPPGRFIRDFLTPAAQARLAELIEQINPLAQMVARARGRRDAKPLNQAAAARTSDCGEAGIGTFPPETRQPIASHRPHRRQPHRLPGRDLRLPPPGSLIRRPYQGRELIVHVLNKGFEFEGKRYRSLSAIARQVTGAHWNGLLFFGLVNQER